MNGDKKQVGKNARPPNPVASLNIKTTVSAYHPHLQAVIAMYSNPKY
jgi:hypothetical protein